MHFVTLIVFFKTLVLIQKFCVIFSFLYQHTQTNRTTNRINSAVYYYILINIIIYYNNNYNYYYYCIKIYNNTNNYKSIL